MPDDEPEGLRRAPRLQGPLHRPGSRSRSLDELRPLSVPPPEAAGTRLDEVIANTPGGLDVGRAVAITEQLAAALDTTHRSGFVDGDIRAARVLLAHDDGRETARLIDGQPRPAAPSLDARADVLGLGSLLFEMLTGRGPFAGPPARAVDLRPGLPVAFEPVFARAFAQQPWERFASTGELAAAARGAAAGSGYAPPPAAAAKPSGSGSRAAFVLIGFAGIAFVAAVVALVLLISSSGGDDNDGGKKTTSQSATPSLPPVAERNLDAAAAAAGCKLSSPPEEGKQHSPDPADWKYKTNPPTSGTHAPVWAEDGAYPFGKAPNVGETTHALEHGRIDFQYGPRLTKAQFDQLRALTAESNGYHQLLFANQTDMPATVAAAAWTKLLTCPTFNPKVFDALRAFRAAYTDKGPEAVP